MDSIALDSLPKTIKEAIYLARRLDLEYIWIDALCIIQQQKDNSDWIRESSRMRSVYGGSYITLAASTAANVYEGGLEVPLYHCGGFCARVTSTQWCRVQTFFSDHAYQEASIHTPLATRAWAFQEKLLSPRIIYFGSNGLFWECRSIIASQYLPDGFPDSATTSAVLSRPENEAFDWFFIVRYYSGANLSYGSDRLPALSGIARKQQEITGETYLAGMWKEGLIEQLPWHRTSEKRKRPGRRVPTWCWTAIDGGVAYDRYRDWVRSSMQDYIRVLDAKSQTSGPDLYGSNVESLSVGCSALVHGQLQGPAPDDLASEHVLLDGAVTPFAIMLDCLSDETDRGNKSVYLLPVYRGFSGSARPVPREDGGEDSDGVLVHDFAVHGLVLQHNGKSKGYFHRIGSFAFYSCQEDKDIRSRSWIRPHHYFEFLEILGDVGEKSAESECARILFEPGNAGMRYVITIE